MKIIEKKYNSVKMMREIRDKLSRKYSKSPGKETEDLEKIRTIYSLKSKIKVA